MTFFKSPGPGGQHKNKTESGVRLFHRPTGILVTATERRSQFQNRAVALALLGRDREALPDYEVVERLTRDDRRLAGLRAEALSSRATSWQKLGERERAAADLSLALRSAPPGWERRAAVEQTLRRLKGKA